MAASAIASLPFINILATKHPFSRPAKLVIEQHKLGAVSVYRYCHIRANHGADTAADAPRRVMHAGVEVASHRYIFGHRENLLRARLYAQLTAFTMVLVYRDTRHKSILKAQLMPAEVLRSQGFNSERSITNTG